MCGTVLQTRLTKCTGWEFTHRVESYERWKKIFDGDEVIWAKAHSDPRHFNKCHR